MIIKNIKDLKKLIPDFAESLFVDLMVVLIFEFMLGPVMATSFTLRVLVRVGSGTLKCVIITKLYNKIKKQIKQKGRQYA